MTLTTPMVYIVRGEEEDCSKEEWRVSFHKITVDEGEEWVPHPPSVPSSESIMWTSLPAICRGRQLVNDRRATVPSDAIACCPSVSPFVRPSVHLSFVGRTVRACVCLSLVRSQAVIDNTCHKATIYQWPDGLNTNAQVTAPQTARRPLHISAFLLRVNS